MLQKALNHKIQIAMVAILVVLLALVRRYEDVLFYDPLLDYFKRNFLQLPLPQMSRGPLFRSLLLRYAINTTLSLGIIYIIFKKRDLTKFAFLLYALFFIFLIGAFFMVLSFFPEHKMVLFYIRRFLIQPLFLLLFIPAFYFQERAMGKNNVS